MLRLPTLHVTPAARRNIETFQTTSAAKQLADDRHTWDVIAWSWAPGPPLRMTLRSELGNLMDFEMDAQGVWSLRENPNAPKMPPRAA